MLSYNRFNKQQPVIDSTGRSRSRSHRPRTAQRRAVRTGCGRSGTLAVGAGARARGGALRRTRRWPWREAASRVEDEAPADALMLHGSLRW